MKTKIVKITLILGLIIFFTTAYAQKCKYDYEKNDEFTGAKSKGNTTKLSNAWLIGLNKVDDTYNLGVFIRLDGEKNLYLEQGDSIMFKFSNGNFVTFYAKVRSAPESQVITSLTAAAIITTYRAVYDIPVDKMNLLKNNAVTHIRMNIGNLVYQEELKEKTTKIFQQNADCIMK